MKKFSTLALAAIAAFTGSQAWAQNGRISSVAITTGVVALTERTAANVSAPVTNTNQPVYVGDNLAGLTFFNGNPGIDGTPTNSSVGTPTSGVLFTLTGSLIPGGAATDLHAFMGYGTNVGPPTQADTYNDVAPLLGANSTYSGLVFAAPNLYSGGPAPLKANEFYMIHHATNGTDYLSTITPFTISAGGSAVTDIKPMSWAGGTAATGASTGNPGYFALAFALPTPTGPYFANLFYYLRTDGAGHTQFGYTIPALVSASVDTIDLTTAVGSFGATGYTTLAFSDTAFGGYATNQFYYLRQDVITGNTILGRLDTDPANRTVSDIANLGGVYRTLTFALNALGTAPAWGASQLYVAGAPLGATAQSISFAAIADRAIVTGAFTVTPSASSGLALTLTVVAGSTGAASITGPIAGVFTVTPTAPGIVTLEAKQSGGAFATNLLRQSFNVTGSALLAITTQPTSQSAVTGATANFSVVASGTTAISYQWRKAGLNVPVTNATATTATLTLTNAQAIDAATYDVVVTNLSGSIISNPVTLTVTGGVPVITNSPLTAAGTVNTPFTFTITATNTPTSYAALSALPAGLSLTGAVISGTPSAGAVGTTAVQLSATNASGVGLATLNITVAAAGSAPIIVNSPLTAAGTVATAFTYTIVATGSPTSYNATNLPTGLSITGATISGTPTITAVGTTPVQLSATNAFGIGLATLNITVSATGVAPIITNNPLTAAGTINTPFSFGITATGSPTSYTATPLPAGLSIVALTGAITGTPTSIGTTIVQLGATGATGTGIATLTITIGSVGAPIITNNPLTAAGTIGKPFSFAITATGLPTSYAAIGLPPGLTIVAATGIITGTPTAVGTTVVILTAANPSGGTAATLTITIGAVTIAPLITSPTIAAGTVGVPFVTYLIAATGLPTSYTAFNLPPGLSLNPLTGAINGTPTQANTTFVTITASNSTGTSTATLMIVIAPAGVAPIITSPTTAPGTVGTPFVTYLIAATGLPTSYSATGLPPGLTINPLTGAINGTPTTAGTYVVTLTATNATGTTTATVTMVIAGVASSRIVNFSARAVSGPGAQTLIMGFVVLGDGKNLLVRGIGPGLTPYGVTNALADPLLTLFDATSAMATNDDWQTVASGQASAALIASTAARVGAFALPNGSKDSALIITVNNGAHTTSMLRPNSTTGVALTEIYDIDENLSARLINVSARMNVVPGEGALVAGFVIKGTVPKTVLIRGVGPTLTDFGVTGVLADPTIAVFSGSTQIASNDNWEIGTSTAAQLSSASARVGAFALTAGSKDASLMVTLQPGNYTVQVTGVANTSGVALVEIYDNL